MWQLFTFIISLFLYTLVVVFSHQEIWKALTWGGFFILLLAMDNADSERNKTAVRKSFEIASRKKLDTLDLIRKQIQRIPSGLDKFDLSNLKFLYLEGNIISFLPEDFFPSLASLEWLDLRNNTLCEIPRNIGEHKKLKTLLLGRNQLKFLPAELGLVKTLTGLNLSDNPLKEPPQTVLMKGIFAVQVYLLEKLGIYPEEGEANDSESDQQSTIESGNHLQADFEEVDNESMSSIVNEKEEIPHRNSAGNHPMMQSVSPQAALAYYGALLGEVPHSYIFKPWKTGVFLRREQMTDDLNSAHDVDEDNSKY